jgi:tungstate transport system ATP-binding protein
MAFALPLRLDGLRYAVGAVEIIRGVTLELHEGAPSLLVGPNGAGKSVLLRLLHGLLQPSGGTVSWARPEARAPGLAPRDAMVFQRPVLLRRSVLANATYPLRLQGHSIADARLRAEAALERVGLGRLLHRPARALSGGEQQKLALARAWALVPEVLFLDEPTAALDPAATRAVEGIVEAIAASGTKVVMTTHDLAQARRLAGEVLFLHHGRVVERSPAAAFFAGPRTEEAAAFLRGELFW